MTPNKSSALVPPGGKRGIIKSPVLGITGRGIKKTDANNAIKKSCKNCSNPNCPGC